MKIIWGIDLGGTKTEGIVYDFDNRKNIARLRVPTEREKGYDHILDVLEKLVNNLKKESGTDCEIIGIGTPGIVDLKNGLLKNSNTTCLISKPLQKDLENRLQVPVKIANDANCFALAELHLGAIAEEKNDVEVIFGVIMGTGVGAGLVVNGKVINGLHGIAGEWGHNFLDESGGKCYCGKTGCVETLISGPALERFYESKTGHHLSLKKIIKAYYKGADNEAKLTVERLLFYFGKAISGIINVIDPDVIIIGGGLGNIDLLYEKSREEIMKHIFNNDVKTRIVRPVLGDSAGVYGAAMLTL